jgi:tripartite-type tricarboxylate transporter receptor subunit TctC
MFQLPCFSSRFKLTNAIYCFFGLLTFTTQSSFAQTTWPEDSVRLIVPYAAGGTADFVARQIAQKLTEQTGKAFYVENKVGGSGTIGTDFVAKAKSDGYTFLINDTTYAMLRHLFKKLPWDHANDFTFVTTLAITPLVVLTSSPP